MREFKYSTRWLAIRIFLMLVTFGALFGASDDEAYYWVLSQTPAWGYVYHPPLAPWLISFFNFEAFGAEWREILAPFFLRLPSALCSSLAFYFFFSWARKKEEGEEPLKQHSLLLSFAPIFGLGWMMVPDQPLFLSLALAWFFVDRLIEKEGHFTDFLGLFLGCLMASLSKFSGVAIPFSAWIAFHFLASPEVKEKNRSKVRMVILTGFLLSILPTLYWNYLNDWAALKYQFIERHRSSDLSLSRFFRFWGIQLAVAGPVFLAYVFTFLSRPLDRAAKLALIFALPPLLIFGIQPLFSEFKPHWILIAWIPFLVDWANRLPGMSSAWKKATRVQVFYGSALIVAVWFLILVPLPTNLVDGKKNVSNDLYGWDEWARHLRDRYGNDLGGRWVVGSRYQTASQAAFALGSIKRVSLMPRTRAEELEWGAAPYAMNPSNKEWPLLKEAILFVTDHRYDEAPRFPSADCKPVDRFDVKRYGMDAKWIETWECSP